MTHGPACAVLCVDDVVTDTAIELIPSAATTTLPDEDGSWLALRLGAKLPFADLRIVDAAGVAGSPRSRTAPPVGRPP